MPPLSSKKTRQPRLSIADIHADPRLLAEWLNVELLKETVTVKHGGSGRFSYTETITPEEDLRSKWADYRAQLAADWAKSKDNPFKTSSNFTAKAYQRLKVPPPKAFAALKVVADEDRAKKDLREATCRVCWANAGHAKTLEGDDVWTWCADCRREQNMRNNFAKNAAKRFYALVKKGLV